MDYKISLIRTEVISRAREWIVPFFSGLQPVSAQTISGEFNTSVPLDCVVGCELNKGKQNKLVEFIYTEVIVVLIYFLLIWISAACPWNNCRFLILLPFTLRLMLSQWCFFLCGAINCTLNVNIQTASVGEDIQLSTD